MMCDWQPYAAAVSYRGRIGPVSVGCVVSDEGARLIGILGTAKRRGIFCFLVIPEFFVI